MILSTWVNKFTEIIDSITTKYEEGLLVKEYRPKNHGKLHRNSKSGPAKTIFYKNGNIKREIYAEHGLYHRNMQIGPAYIEYYEDGTLKLITYFLNGNIYQDKYCIIGKNNILHIEYYESGAIKTMAFSRDKKFHNDPNEPARIWYYENHNIKLLEYYQNGLLHRINAPASIRFYPNGKPKHKKYYRSGFLHRENAPARITYNEDGTILSKMYYHKGSIYDPLCGFCRF